MEEKRTKLQIGCMIAMGGVFVLFLVLYLVMSFRVECRINGEVFAVKRQGESTLFTGRLTHQKGTITMTPQGQTTTFAFDFSPQFQESYQVTLEEETTLTCQITDSFGEDTLETEEALVLPVTVTGSAGNVLLDAYYQDSWRGSFWDEGGNVLDGGWDITITTNVDTWEDFQPPLNDLVALAAGDKVPQRREVHWGMFALFTLLGGVLCLQIAFPMAFFYLEHFLSVQDPEPSDLYLALMPISWVLSPILLAVGYLVLLVAG